MPYVVLFNEPEGSTDMGLVEAMRPTGYGADLWRWIVEQNARRLFLSEGFDAAFAEAVAQIEQQMASA
jgi:hypothetical protein